MNRLFFLALRNVSRNKRRTATTVCAILFGVAVIVIANGFASAFVDFMVQYVVKGRTGALQVHRKGYVDSSHANAVRLNMKYSPEMVAKIRGVPGVTAVTSRLIFNGLASNGVNQTNFIGRGLDAVNEKQVCPQLSRDITEGADLAPEDSDKALLGLELAKSFGLTSMEGGAEAPRITLSTTSPRGRANSISVATKGLTTSAMVFENKRLVTLPLQAAQDLVGLEGRVTEYAIAIENLEQLDRVAADLRAALGPEYEVHTWQQLQPYFRDLIERQRTLLGLISVILGVVVLAGIINTMLMSVFERVREIGTMMATGVRRRQVMMLFLFEAAVIGFIGGALGVVLGKVVVVAMSAQGIPLQMPNTSVTAMLRPSVTFTLLAGMLIAAVAGALFSAAYPAWKASRLRPVEALRST